ncbi:MAG: biosynthetic-type acetolactate synthase large subunit [Massiliimalia sp.]|jgi:acetolactate synthase-1/2/3 large subunit
MITVAQAIVKCLEEEQISVVFGYPGAAICPFYDALSKSHIHHVLVRQEQNAGHAASGYARISGKPAVCIATSGPGALNLITAIATAYMDSIPMVIITGQVSRELLGRDVFQEADITGAVEPFIKYSYLVKDASKIGTIMKEAFYLAGTGRPGPVLVDVPVDVQSEKIQFAYPETVHMRSYNPTVKGHPGQIKRAMTALKNAKRPLLCAGGGVFAAHAVEQLRQFCKKTQIPVITTMMGISAIPYDDPLYFGMLGSHGVKVANHAIHQADVLLLIGARAGDRAVRFPHELSESTRIIHIDVDPAEIGKNLETGIPIVGDAKHVLEEMISKAVPLECEEWVATLKEIRDSHHERYRFKDGFINPKIFINRLTERAPEGSVVVADVGQNQIWTANHFHVKEGRFLTSGGMGTMGYSIPAAEGAKFAAPDKTVIAVCGDGSFQMQMMELGTICQENNPVKIVVMTNHYLGMVREIQEKAYANNIMAVSLQGSPDITQIARSYGMQARRICSMDEVDEAIDELLQSTGPCLLECSVAPEESTL